MPENSGIGENFIRRFIISILSLLHSENFHGRRQVELNNAFDPQRTETVRFDEAIVLNQLPSKVKQVTLDAINKVSSSHQEQEILMNFSVGRGAKECKS